eukprot:2630675-Amphidinium_carterae.1
MSSHVSCTVLYSCEAHALPAVQIGFGSASFNYKLCSLCHAIRLEHATHESMAAYMASVRFTVSDQGVE